MVIKKEQLIGHVVSEGTLHPQDLAVAFHSELMRLENDRDADELWSALCHNVDVPNRTDERWWGETVTDIIFEMVQCIEQTIPDDVFFGTHPGNGSLFMYFDHNEDLED